MRRVLGFIFPLILMPLIAFAQTGQQQQQSQQNDQEDVVRITTALVQTDVVVTDKSDRIVPDLKLGDFELYENGKKQDIKFMEFVGVDTGRRTEGERPTALPAGAEIPRDLSAKELKRVVAFVIDDLTIPFADMATVRQLLLDFVNNEMQEGDLVAIIRTIGGKGLLQQFTSDKQLLRRAIAQLNVSTNPYMAYNNPAQDRFTSTPTPSGAPADGGESNNNFEELGLTNQSDPNDEFQRLYRGLMSLTTANFVINSLKEIPGRKSLVIVSGGIPIFETANNGSAFSNLSYLLNQLSDNAVRAGVVINTMDPRGLKASMGVASFVDTPAKSALGGAPDPNFGRGGGSDEMFGLPLAGAAEHLGLSTVAETTGGISVVNTNNFKGGLDKVLARSQGYYILAYTPADKFDNKFRKLEIKVKRDGAHIYAHRGYVAREERGETGPRTKEQSIAAAVTSPISKRDIDVSANLDLKPSTTRGGNQLDIHLLIDPSKLNFTQSPDGRYQTSFDVVGFVYDQMGRVRGGFSETVNTNLAPESYREALKTGLTYSASTQLPPGYFQVRAAVREASTGNVGTISRYLEIPDISNGRLAMSSIFLFAADPSQSKAAPVPLLAARQVTQKQDLRYAAMIYNPKNQDSKTQLTSQVIISQGDKIVYKEPEQPLQGGASPITKIGQLGTSGVPPGRYVLTLVVNDQLADKKYKTVARSVDFTVVK
jgi:VWFA-related protein